MNRNNVVYTWQFNRNPLIDYPDLVEYIWGNNVGDVWQQPLGIDEVGELSIKIYPNPTTNGIYLTGIKGSTTLEVFSVDGRRLSVHLIENDSFLDLNLSSGLYVLKLSSDGKTLTTKLIIE